MKEGDLVICVNNQYFKNTLTVGKKYTIVPKPTGDGFVLEDDLDCITIQDDLGYIHTFTNNRFELDIQSMRDNAINNILN